MNLFSSAGYLKSNLVASSNAVVFSYVLYLIGRYEYKVSSTELQKIIRKWIFMSTITGFYTGSTESEVEKQFADMRNIHTAAEFIAYLDSVIATRFTDDYFTHTLPSELKQFFRNLTRLVRLHCCTQCSGYSYAVQHNAFIPVFHIGNQWQQKCGG